MLKKADQMLLKNKLAANKLLQSVLKSARRRGGLDLYITGQEKYDHQRWDENDNELPEKVKGPGEHYDVEGHSWTDVYGFYDVRWWHPTDIAMLFRWMVRWAKEVREFKSWEYSRNTFPLFGPYSAWVWAPASIQCAARDMAEKQKMDPLFEREGKPNQEELRAAIREVDTMADQLLLNPKKISQWLFSEGYIKLSLQEYSLWLSPEDPSCFYCDAPYDLKDGWSDEKVGEIILSWYLGLWHSLCLEREVKGEPVLRVRLVTENRIHLHERIAHVARTYVRKT